jgi:hypothetical protein
MKGSAGITPLGWSGRRLARARQVVESEGLRALCQTVVRRYVADCRRFYLYEHHHRHWPEGAFLPHIEQFEERFISSNEVADEVASEFQDLRQVVENGRRGLESGAVAFCVYAGRDVAHVAWLATSERARRAVDHLGYVVHFDDGEAWTGAAYTVPAYRGRGLLAYGCQRRFEYLLRRGCSVSRGAVEMSNDASHRATMRFEPRVYAIGRQWRLCGKRWWRQTVVE